MIELSDPDTVDKAKAWDAISQKNTEIARLTAEIAALRASIPDLPADLHKIRPVVAAEIRAGMPSIRRPTWADRLYN